MVGFKEADEFAGYYLIWHSVDQNPLAAMTSRSSRLPRRASGKPFKLYSAERRFIEEAFTVTDEGRLRCWDFVFSAPKKSGKTAIAAIAKAAQIQRHMRSHSMSRATAARRAEASGRYENRTLFCNSAQLVAS
jgi:hypothetical protein